jgi:hypothetical protein
VALGWGLALGRFRAGAGAGLAGGVRLGVGRVCLELGLLLL